jgi:hypothetical protein
VEKRSPQALKRVSIGRANGTSELVPFPVVFLVAGWVLHANSGFLARLRRASE